jgi:methionyl-tRNA synthetase
MPYDNDGTMTWDLLVERINSDLVNVLGNLVNRTIAMANKYFAGVVTNPEVREPVDQELQDMVVAMPKKVIEKMDQCKTSDALDEIFKVLRRTNKYIDETMPWVLAKEEDKQDRLATVLYNLIESIRFCAIALQSSLPQTATSILDQINTDQRELLDLTTFGLYKSGTKVATTPEMLFVRLDPKEIEKKVQALQPKEEKKEIVIETPITIDDFTKIELVVGTVEACEKHPDADKLLVSQINIGKEIRQIVSGIAGQYTPEDMIGKKLIIVANLKPAMLRGIESQGMILAGSSKKLLEVIEVKDLPNGTRIK